MSTDSEVIAEVFAAFDKVERPEHFTNHLHCEECAEHDALLTAHDRETLELDHVATIEGDPINFCSPQGKAYYLPNLVRFALEDTDLSSPYWIQLTRHLEGDGPENSLILYCSHEQRTAVALFLEHLLETRASFIDFFDITDQMLRTHGYWLPAA